MNRELTAAARDERLRNEMVNIVRLVADLHTGSAPCPFCASGLEHENWCIVIRARCVLAALDTPEERTERYANVKEVYDAGYQVGVTGQRWQEIADFDARPRAWIDGWRMGFYDYHHPEDLDGCTSEETQ